MRSVVNRLSALWQGETLARFLSRFKLITQAAVAVATEGSGSGSLMNLSTTRQFDDDDEEVIYLLYPLMLLLLPVIGNYSNA